MDSWFGKTVEVAIPGDGALGSYDLQQALYGLEPVQFPPVGIEKDDTAGTTEKKVKKNKGKRKKRPNRYRHQ